MLPRSSKKQFGSHNSDVDVAMDATDLFSGADNTSLQAGFGKQFLHPATKLCPPGLHPRRRGSFVPRLCSRATARSASTIALLAMRSGQSRILTKSGLQFSRKIVRCTSRYSVRDPMLNHFPSFIDNAADFSALGYPIRNNRNERDLFARRNPLENRGVPNRDIGKIKVSRDAVAVADIHDTVDRAKPRRQLNRCDAKRASRRFSRRKCSSIKGWRSTSVKISPL